MATQAHRWLGIAAAGLAVVGVVGWRSISGTGAAGPAAIPNTLLSELLPFAKPIPDTLNVVQAGADTVVLPRDPFVEVTPARIARPRAVVTDTRPRRAAESLPWIVSATLTGGARRAAIINDELVYVGDSLPDGTTLTAVERDRIVLTDAKGATHTVAVTEGEG